MQEIDFEYKKKYPVSTDKYEQAREKYLIDPKKLKYAYPQKRDTIFLQHFPPFPNGVNNVSNPCTY